MDGYENGGLYPGPRERAREPINQQSNLSSRMQSTSGYVTTGDTSADVLVFTGEPDRIEVWVLDNAVVLTPVDVHGRLLQPIEVEAGVFYELLVRARAVQARNRTAGANARVQVVGKWGCRCGYGKG